MSVHKTKGEVPQGAVRLTEEEAINRQWKFLFNWTPTKDVWVFRYGSGLLGVCSAFSAIYINSHYRNKLRLRDFGRFSSYLPIVVLPTILSGVFHHQIITNDVIIAKTICPACIQMRSAGIQTFFSTVYPAILAPLSGYMFATRYFTYDLPPLSKPLEHVRVWKKITHPIGNTLFLLCVCQALLGVGMAYWEEEAYHKVLEKFLVEDTETLSS